MEDSKKSNKIKEIVRLQQILKKWKKLANAPKSSNSTNNNNNNNGSSSSSKSINKFLKKTLSFSDSTSISNDVLVPPKGFLAVCVGKEMKRFIIPTEYLGHQAFRLLLREAEEEFGFEQEGVLKIPCQVPLFEKILKMVEEKGEAFFLHESIGSFNIVDNIGCLSPESELSTPSSHHPQLCR